MYGAVSSWREQFAQKTPNQKESASERFVAEENEQLLKNVKRQEVKSLVQTPRSHNVIIQHLETDCENVFQRIETLEKDIQFTKVCDDASFWRRVSIRMSCKTIRFGD